VGAPRHGERDSTRGGYPRLDRRQRTFPWTKAGARSGSYRSRSSRWIGGWAMPAQPPAAVPTRIRRLRERASPERALARVPFGGRGAGRASEAGGGPRLEAPNKVKAVVPGTFLEARRRDQLPQVARGPSRRRCRRRGRFRRGRILDALVKADGGGRPRSSGRLAARAKIREVPRESILSRSRWRWPWRGGTFVVRWRSSSRAA